MQRKRIVCKIEVQEGVRSQKKILNTFLKRSIGFVHQENDLVAETLIQDGKTKIHKNIFSYKLYFVMGLFIFLQ